MLSHLFDTSSEIYTNATMPMKIIYEIISAEANATFSSEVSHIVSKRNWGKDEFDPNDVCQIKHMNADMEAAVYMSCTLRHLYESEYGKMTNEVEEKIKEIASKYANTALRKFGWIKEENV